MADRLCTRFPTRIVSRRTPNESEITKISIEPSPDDWAGAFGCDNDGAGAFGSEGGGFLGSNKKLDDRAKRQEAYRNFAYSSPNITADGFKDAIDQVRLNARLQLNCR